MGDVEFCENESEEVDKTFSTLFVTRLLPKKKFFETIEVFWWRPGFFKKRVDFSTTSYLCGVDVAIHFCGKKYFLFLKKFNLVYTTS